MTPGKTNILTELAWYIDSSLLLSGWGAILNWTLQKLAGIMRSWRLLALLTCKCINNIAPDYLKKCIKVKEQPTRLLRNDKDYFLLNVPSPIPNYKRTDRSFSYASPNVWNSLPYHLRTCSNISLFKKQLKTFLFQQAFEHV